MAKGKGKQNKVNEKKEEKSSVSSSKANNEGKEDIQKTSNQGGIKEESKQADREEETSQMLTVSNDTTKASEKIAEKASSDVSVTLNKKNENSSAALEEKMSEKGKDSAQVRKKSVAAPPKVEDSPLTATVFLAAQVPKNGRLAITGSDYYLGEWKAPQGTFDRILEIQSGLFIFKSTIPVPSRSCSPFKFVEVVGEKIEYEGRNKDDNRLDEILPDSWNFFIYKHRSEGLGKKLVNLLFGLNTDVAGKIVVQFMEIAFNHAKEEVIKNWNSGVTLLLDHLNKIRKVKGGNVSDEFRQFLNQRLKQTDLADNFDHLFLLIVGAFHYGIFSKNLLDFIEPKHTEFSLYLYRFNKYSPATKQLFVDVLEQIAITGGSTFWWIFFHINRWSSERSRKVEPEDMCKALLETVSSIPEVLLSDNACASRLLDFLLKLKELDWIAYSLFQSLSNNPQLWTTVENSLIAKVLTFKSSVDDLVQVLKSDFVEAFYKRTLQPDSLDASLSQQKESFKQFILQIYNKTNLLDTLQLACSTPQHLLPFVVPIVEDLVAQKSSSISTLSLRNYKNLALLDDGQLKNFPIAKQRIDASILKMTDEIVRSGKLNDIPTTKLLLLGLTRKEDLTLLNRFSCIDLQKALSKVPTKFFHNLHSILNFNSNNTLKQHRKGETKAVVECLENHFDNVSEVINKVNTREIPVIEVGSLMDPQVLSYLRHAGLDESSISAFRHGVEQLRTHHILYAGLYNKFSRLNIVGEDGIDEAEEKLEEEDQTVLVFDTAGWESYLKEIHPDHSILKLRSALDAIKPLEIIEAKWLDQVKDCPLFMEKIWKNMVVRERERVPLIKQDLSDFVKRCASLWMQLAVNVANGRVPFEEMQKIVQLQPDARSLSQFHLNPQNRALANVIQSYRDFKSLYEIRLLISPFVAALRLFSIKQRAPIEELYNFVNEKLVNNWQCTTLSQVRSMGIVETLKTDLQIDSERPESRKAMEFISSLVTDDNGGSPLIDWLRNKKEKDMEAMGKILQGTLLEAYGQLQTLKTRISPFLNKEFGTYQEVLRTVRESEQRFR